MQEVFWKIVKYLEIRSTEDRAEGTIHGEVVANAIDMCIDVIKSFVKEYNNGWIPCNKRLPDKKEYLENDGRFIVTDGNRRYGMKLQNQKLNQIRYW